jgi:hypothetical protein
MMRKSMKTTDSWEFAQYLTDNNMTQKQFDSKYSKLSEKTTKITDTKTGE